MSKLDLSSVHIGVGTNAWGSHGKARPELLPVFQAALKIGVGFFDTAEIYGGGGSERTLGLCLDGLGQRAGGPRPLVLSKFFPMPWRFQRKDFVAALRATLERLRIPSLDVYLIHFPLGRTTTWVNALGDVVEAGLARAVGVSNFSALQMRRAYDVLQRHGIPLVCNEVEYSLLRREPERNGTLAACRELGATMIAYRPLGLGLLTRGSAKNPSRGWRRLLARGMQGAATDRLRALLAELGDAHGGMTAAQVALNWVQRKGALPIPGATSVAHLEENAGSLGWALTDAEVAALDEASGRAVAGHR
jgi:aryl-alcohol dehydrogenase-like predicted oxidoreductase